MISVATNAFHLDCVPITDALRCFNYDSKNFLIQKRFSVFHRKHYMIVNLPSTMVSLLTSSMYRRVRHKRSPWQAHGELQVKFIEKKALHPSRDAA